MPVVFANMLSENAGREQKATMQAIEGHDGNLT